MAGKRSLGYAAAAVLMAGIAASIAAAYWLTQPPRLTLGYVEGASPETQIIKAFDARLGRERKPGFKLALRGFPDVDAMRAAFTGNAIDLAPFATWEPVPDTAETVAILQRTRILLVALDRDGETRRTTAERVAIVAADDLAARLGALIVDAAFDGSAGAPPRLSPAEAARALQAGRIEIAAIAAANGTPLLRQLIAALPAAQQAKVAVRAAPRADQLARQNPAIESVELKIGAASSDPLLPDDDIETLSVTSRLMARRAVSEKAITDFTRVLLSQQRRLAQATPAATQLEPPPTERGAAFPTHAGAAAYVDNEERTFFERYGDWFYLALFGGSGLGSVWAAVESWRGDRRRRSDLRRLAALQALVSEVAGAASPAEVEAVTARYRALMTEVIAASARLQVTQADLAAFSIASALFRDTRRERIAALARSPEAAA
jgi:hypothetical protein